MGQEMSLINAGTVTKSQILFEKLKLRVLLWLIIS